MKNTNLMQAGALNPKQLVEARLQAHYAAQWLARIARSYIPARPDESHACLTWSYNDQAMITHYLPNDIAFGLVVSELTLFCVDPDGFSKELPLDGKNDEEVKEWVEACLEETGLDIEELNTELPYHLPKHPIMEGATYDTIDTAVSLEELGLWFDDAHKILLHIARENAKKAVRTSNVRLWPQHFNMAFLMQVRNSNPKISPMIGVGMSPGDFHYNQPYFYVTPIPFLKPVSLPELPHIGHWHVQGFVGAVALGSRIIEHEHRERVLLTFLREAVAVGQHRLSI